MSADPKKVRAGGVTFHAQNAGGTPHRLFVVRTELAPDALPRTPQGAVDEDQVRVVGESNEIPPGQSDDLPAVLAPGNYVLCSEVPGSGGGFVGIPFIVVP